MPDTASALLGLLLLLITATAAALLLRPARCPGWSIVGGVLAGVLLGPTVMGRVLPQTHERMFVGGAAEREMLRALIQRQGADLLAAQQTGADAEMLRQRQERQTLEREPLDDAWADARRAHRTPLRTAALLLAALTGLGAAACGVRSNVGGQGMVAPLSIGSWSALLPGAGVYVAMTAAWGHSRDAALLAAAAVAIGPWVLTDADREAADRAEVGGARMLERAGRVATILAILGAGLALWRQSGAMGLLWAAPLAALPAGWVIGVPRTAAIAATTRAVILPALAALVAVRIEVLQHAALWPILLLVLLSGDGRWLGALIGAMLPGGRHAMRTMRLVLGSMAAGPTQLMVTVIAVWTWSLPDELPLALLLGAVVVEMSVPLRRSMARRVEETEEKS